MRILNVLFVTIGILHLQAYGQQTFSLSGKVTGENNNPLAGATIFLIPVNKGLVSNSEGKFSFTDITQGQYEVQVAHIGYNTISKQITIKNNSSINIRLKEQSQTLQEVVIADHSAEEYKKEQTLNVEIVNDKYLEQNRNGSLMKSLERLPGISTISIGSGQSKPVIRGLGFNRVVVVENGLKHEAQQWGADHGLEIDQYAIDELEIIKGPSSLIYGADAIGGVIRVKQNHIPLNNSIGGKVNLTSNTNNNSLGTSVSIGGRKKWFFANARLTYIDYADYKVPTNKIGVYSYNVELNNNRLRNTAGNELNYHLIIGIIKNSFSNKTFISNVNSKNGFFANAHGLEPKFVDEEKHDKSSRDILFPNQTANHFKVLNNSNWNGEKHDLEINLGYQHNLRQELNEYTPHGYMPPLFPDSLPFSENLEREFDKAIFSLAVKFNYQLTEKINLSLGTNSQFQDNKINGSGFIIPEFNNFSQGGFALARYKITNELSIQAGLRHDYGQIHSNDYFDWFQSPVIDENKDTTWQYLQRAQSIQREFNNVSWSVGGNYNLKKVSFKLNMGKSFRMPIAKELAANGVNYHYFRYEVGNPNLDPEQSYQVDFGLEYHGTKFAIGATPFFNYFTNYIYLNPTYHYDRLYGAGHQIYEYTQSEVLRWGGEIHAHYEIFESLQLGIMAEYVYSEQMSGHKKGAGLPFSPPASSLINLKYKKLNIGYIQQFYASIDYKLSAKQTRIVPPEEITDAYQIINLAFGGLVNIKTQPINITLQINNLLNSKYYNHTSFYRLINVPEPGRSLKVNIAVPFLIKTNK